MGDVQCYLVNCSLVLLFFFPLPYSCGLNLCLLIVVEDTHFKANCRLVCMFHCLFSNTFHFVSAI